MHCSAESALNPSSPLEVVAELDVARLEELGDRPDVTGGHEPGQRLAVHEEQVWRIAVLQLRGEPPLG
jgi:hypothetical protein